MEPEEHIVEKFFQVYEKCFTMSNIPCENRKEIDLLAINPRKGVKYHVEISCPLGKQNWVQVGDTKNRGIKWFAKEKFEHESIVKKIRDVLGDDIYHKILVVYGINEGSYDTIPLREIAYKEHNIHIWLILDLIQLLKEEMPISGSRDDVLRFIELIAHEDRESAKRFEKLVEKIRNMPIIVG